MECRAVSVWQNQPRHTGRNISKIKDIFFPGKTFKIVKEALPLGSTAIHDKGFS